MTTQSPETKGVYTGLPTFLSQGSGAKPLAVELARVPGDTEEGIAGHGGHGPRTICIGAIGSGRFRRIEARWSHCRADSSPPEVLFVARDGTEGVLRLRRGQWCLVLEGVGLPECDHLLRLFDLAAGVRVLAGLSRDADEPGQQPGSETGNHRSRPDLTSPSHA